MYCKINTRGRPGAVLPQLRSAIVVANQVGPERMTMCEVPFDIGRFGEVCGANPPISPNPPVGIFNNQPIQSDRLEVLHCPCD